MLFRSTLLRLLAGIYPPSEGTVLVHGTVAPIIELGAGFHPELTGAENVALYASVFGLGRRELDSKWKRILEFSEIGAGLETPIKYLSSGTVARLAFSVAISIAPDVLLLDEVLAVGDEAFRIRCLRRLKEFNSEGGTILLVTHEFDQITELCTRAIWLEQGSIVRDGTPDTVVREYMQHQESRA